MIIGEYLAPRLVAEGLAMRCGVAADGAGDSGVWRPRLRAEDAGTQKQGAGNQGEGFCSVMHLDRFLLGGNSAARNPGHSGSVHADEWLPLIKRILTNRPAIGKIRAALSKVAIDTEGRSGMESINW